MTTETEAPVTADAILAEIEAALDDIRRAHDTGDHAATAAGYERRAAAWTTLYRDECRQYDVLSAASPAVLQALLRTAIPGAAVDDRTAARDYRRLVDQQARG